MFLRFVFINAVIFYLIRKVQLNCHFKLLCKVFPNFYKACLKNNIYSDVLCKNRTKFYQLLVEYFLVE